jgi:hypothetical protein
MSGIMALMCADEHMAERRAELRDKALKIEHKEGKTASIPYWIIFINSLIYLEAQQNIIKDLQIRFTPKQMLEIIMCVRLCD